MHVGIGFFNSSLILEPDDLVYERKAREMQVLQVVSRFRNSFRSTIDTTVLWTEK